MPHILVTSGSNGAAAKEEKDYRYPKNLPRVWMEVDVVHRLDAFTKSDGQIIRDAGPPGGFRLRVHYNPKDCALFGIQIEVIPPDRAKDEFWIVPDVDYEVTLFNFKKSEIQPRKCLHLHGVEIFQNPDDPHYVDLIRTSEMTVDKGYLNEDGQFRMRVRAHLPHTDDNLTDSIKHIDFSQALETVTFKLPNDEVLYADKRVLIKRSEYFRDMLSERWKEGQTNEVDLTTDPHACKRSLNGVLLYIVSGTFTCDGDEKYAFGVRHLADRFLLPHLCDVVDAELETLLETSNVLRYWGEVVNTRGTLQEQCRRMVLEDNCAVLENYKDDAKKMITANPILAEILFDMLLAQRNAKPKPA